MDTLENGKIVGYQGKGTGRPIYEVVYNGVTQRVAITTGSNGFIVGANPVSIKYEGRKVMNTVKLRLEYKCFPMWIHDEQGNLIDNDIVEEISDDNEIVNLLDNIQEEFNELYVDDGIEFSFKGFQNEQSIL